MTAPDVLTFEQYASMHGCSRLDYGEPAMHKRRRSQTDAQWSRIVDAQAKRDSELSDKRDRLREDYREAIIAGYIRPPTVEEECEILATGHPDNEATKAAIECLKVLSEGVE